jgi:hypothetical protein
MTNTPDELPEEQASTPEAILTPGDPRLEFVVKALKESYDSHPTASMGYSKAPKILYPSTSVTRSVQSHLPAEEIGEEAPLETVLEELWRNGDQER